MNNNTNIFPLYSTGDVVCIMDLDELKARFGKNIRVPSSWANGMNAYAGTECTISKVISTRPKPIYTIQEDGGRFSWDECVLVPPTMINLQDLHLEITIEDII